MAEAGSRVLLVSQQDKRWIGVCKEELRTVGVATVEAHNCWSADLVLGRDDVEVVLIDGDILCDWISPERPGPILGRDPHVKVVVINAQNLNQEHRAAVLGHRAALVEGSDIGEIASVVRSALKIEGRPSYSVRPPTGAS